MKEKVYFGGFKPGNDYLKTEEYIIRSGFKLFGSGYPPHEIFAYSYVLEPNIHLEKQLVGNKYNVIHEIDDSRSGLSLEEAIKYCKELKDR